MSASYFNALQKNVRLQNALYLASVSKDGNVLIENKSGAVKSLDSHALAITTQAFSILLLSCSAYPSIVKQFGEASLDDDAKQLTLDQFAQQAVLVELLEILELNKVEKSLLLQHDLTLWSAALTHVAVAYCQQSGILATLEAEQETEQAATAGAEQVKENTFIHSVSFAQVSSLMQRDSVVRNIVLESAKSLAAIFQTF